MQTKVSDRATARGEHRGEGGRGDMDLRRSVLVVLLVSIACNALLGIWALLAGEFGETQSRILTTSLLVSAAMLSVLVNTTPLTRRLLWPVPAVAVAAGVAGFAVLIWLVWVPSADDAVTVKLAITGLVVAAAGTLAGLLALVPLPTGYGLVRRVEYVLIALLAGTGLVGMWLEVDTSWYARVVGVQSVLVAAVTLALPVLWRLGSPAPDGPVGATGPGRPPRDEPGADQRPGRRITVGDLTSRYVISTEPTASLRDLVDEFVLAGVSFLVIKDSHSVAGVVSEHDVLQAIHDGADLDEVWAADVMSTDLVAVDAGANLAEAVRLMLDNGIRHLLVTGATGGVVSIRDVLAAVSPAVAAAESGVAADLDPAVATTGPGVPADMGPADRHL